MATMKVTLINGQTGEEYPAEVWPDDPVGSWVRDMAALMGLPPEVGGQPVRYRFVIERTERAVTEEETLRAAGLHAGDRVRLECAVLEAPPAKPVPPPSAPAASVTPAPLTASTRLGYLFVGLLLGGGVIWMALNWWSDFDTFGRVCSSPIGLFLLVPACGAIWIAISGKD